MQMVQQSFREVSVALAAAWGGGTEALPSPGMRLSSLNSALSDSVSARFSLLLPTCRLWLLYASFAFAFAFVLLAFPSFPFHFSIPLNSIQFIFKYSINYDVYELYAGSFPPNIIPEYALL